MSHTFVGKNTSKKPLIILNVVSSCGCTVPYFSKKPILPNENFEVRVLFDPKDRPGMFTKDLGVYSHERIRIATLTVRGQVTPRPRSIEERFPIRAGEALRLSNNFASFPYLYIGSELHTSISYINTSDRSLTLWLKPRTQSGILKITAPRTIAPHEQGSIDFGYYIDPKKPTYGTQNDVMEIWIDHQFTHTILSAHGIAIDKPHAKGEKSLPNAILSKNIVKFGAVKPNASIESPSICLQNQGTGDLIVRKIELEEGFTTSLQAPRVIKSGEEIQFEITLHTAQLPEGNYSKRMMIITNDPTRPMRRIRVSAIIEQRTNQND